METDAMKKCCGCGILKPLTEFHRRSSRPCGVAPRCKVCKAQIAAEYRSKNLQACKDRSLDWYSKNKDRSIATTRAWQDAHKDRVKEKRQQWLGRQKGI